MDAPSKAFSCVMRLQSLMTSIHWRRDSSESAARTKAPQPKSGCVTLNVENPFGGGVLGSCSSTVVLPNGMTPLGCTSKRPMLAGFGCLEP